MWFFPSFRISQKLPLALVGSAIVVGAGVGIASYFLAANALETQARQNLATIASERASQLRVYMNSVEADLTRTAKAEYVQQAVANFAAAYAGMTNVQLKMDAGVTLRKAFLVGDPSQRVMLDQVPGGVQSGVPAAYGFNHAHYNPVFRAQIQDANYSDLYLFDLLGNVVYSTGKQDDFGTSFAKENGGKYADSRLGDAYRSALQASSPDAITFTDFARYAADGNAPRLFMAAPVFDATNNKVGVIAVSLNSAALTRVVNSRQGLGDSGDTIIVGADGLARGDSAGTGDSAVLQPTVFNAAINQAIGSHGTAITEASFGGADVIAATAPVIVPGGKAWGLVALMSKSEIFAPVATLTSTMAAIGGGLLAVVAILGWLFALSVSRPINRLTTVMNKLAAGDLEVDIPGVAKHDELGEMARAVEIFRENAGQVRSMTANERAASEQRRVDRAAMMDTLSRSFGEVVDAAVVGDFSKRVDANFADGELNALAGSINNLVSTVERGLNETGDVLSALADTDLTRRVEGDYHGAFGKLKDDTNAVADKLTGIVGQLRETSRALKLATGEILSGANDLSERTTKQAAAIEETSAAMEQFAAMVADSAKAANEASRKTLAVSETAEQGGKIVRAANEAMERITTSSSKISNIIGLIDDIAFQTNLLALNASVEAARAGDAGKGFAVVAVEVRRLAQSAAGASSEVKALIEVSAADVGQGSKLVADAAGKLDDMLSVVRENAGLINGIAQRSREQASAIEEVNESMRRMDEMTQHNAALVEETNASIEQTEAQAVELDRIVDVFTLDDGGRQAELAAQPGAAAKGIRGLQQRVAAAAQAYLGPGAGKVAVRR